MSKTKINVIDKMEYVLAFAKVKKEWDKVSKLLLSYQELKELELIGELSDLIDQLQKTLRYDLDHLARNSLLDGEIKWIESNAGHYEGPLHKQAVIGNIKNRYEISALKRQIKHLEARQ